MTSVADRYAAAAACLSAVVSAVPAAGWTRPSPCDGWTARDVIEHVVTTETAFLAERTSAAPDVDGTDPVVAWPVVRDAVQAVLNDPARAAAPFDGYFGPTTVEDTIDRFYTADLLVHRWDLATAVGLVEHATLDDDELAYLERAVGSYPPDVMRMPGLFGPEVAPPADADATTRLMAFLGRRA